MATDAKTPGDDCADPKDPRTRELWFGGRLDSGWLKQRRRDNPDREAD